MRVRVINPIVPDDLDVLPPLPSFVEAEIDWLEDGPTSVECRVDAALCVPPLLDRVRVAAADGVDGIVISCCMDCGVDAARELVDIPVAGPMRSAMTLALTLGQTFSVILPASSGTPIVVEQATATTGRERLASVRSVEMSVAEFSNAARLTEALIEQAELAVEEDGAHVVILGCTGMSGVTVNVRQALQARGVSIPVIDPTVAAVGNVVAQVMLGVRHSVAAYEVPSWKAGATG